MKIRRLQTSTDVEAFREIRIESTREAPESFRATEEEMLAEPVETFRHQLSGEDDAPIFIGAFEESTLVGVAGLFLEDSQKLAHKAIVGSVFVTPASRSQGIGKALITELMQIAKVDLKLKQLNLTVNTRNQTALRIYENFGFRIFGTEVGAVMVNGVGYDEHHMQCVLEQIL